MPILSWPFSMSNRQSQNTPTTYQHQTISSANLRIAIHVHHNKITHFVVGSKLFLNQPSIGQLMANCSFENLAELNGGLLSMFIISSHLLWCSTVGEKLIGGLTTCWNECGQSLPKHGTGLPSIWTLFPPLRSSLAWKKSSAWRCGLSRKGPPFAQTSKTKC